GLRRRRPRLQFAVDAGLLFDDLLEVLVLQHGSLARGGRDRPPDRRSSYRYSNRASKVFFRRLLRERRTLGHEDAAVLASVLGRPCRSGYRRQPANACSRGLARAAAARDSPVWVSM